MLNIDNSIGEILQEIKGSSHVSSKPKPKVRTGHSLAHYILKVMCPGAHKQLKVIAQKIKEAGYQTNNKKFASYLYSTLNKRTDIKKNGHGTYYRVAGPKKIINPDITNDDKDKEIFKTPST